MEDKVINVLQEIRPEVDHFNVDNYIEQGIFDSLDIILLVSKLDENFSICIDGSEIIPENFLNLSAINALVSRKVNEK